MRHISLPAALLLCIASCARDKTAGTATTAAAIAKAIAAKPAAADSILKANGQTSDSFEAMMYDIASDSAMSVAYAAARKK
jgi:hypothetical protein